jgi:hypothetical protein
MSEGDQMKSHHKLKKGDKTLNPNKANKNRNANKGGKGIKGSSLTSAPFPSTSVTRMAVTPTVVVPALLTSATRPKLRTIHDSNGKVRTLKKWCFDERTPVYFAPDELRPSSVLNKGAVVELTGKKRKISISDLSTSWSEMAYAVYDKKVQTVTHWVIGWVNDAYLDDYNEKFPDSGVVIPNPTTDPHDAQQYMILENKARFNMCGELCVAFIVNDDIDSALAKWKKNSPHTYNRILAEGKDVGTLESDLKNMLAAILGEYGFGSDADQIISFKERLQIPLTPDRMVEALEKMLVTHYLIVLVTINSSGELMRKDNLEVRQINHWVLLDKITRNGARVELYNPFPNKREEYSFNEFYFSCRLSRSGLWVKRKEAHLKDSIHDFPTFHVVISNPNPLYSAAQYIDVDGKKKTQLCGEFCVAFILKESIDAVLEHWKEVQPNLYADTVGNNKGTGIFDLITILKAFGYTTDGDFTEFAARLTDPFLKKYMLSPGRMAKMLETHYLIAGVNIDGITGKLKGGQDVRHWVVVDKITPVGRNIGGNGGWVELYNPFPNSWEEYSYREFTKSVGAQGSWIGLWVKRNIIPKFTPQVVVPSGTGNMAGRRHNSRRDGRIRKWTEIKLRAAINQKHKKERSANKIAKMLAEKSSWKKREILDIINKRIKKRPDRKGKPKTIAPRKREKKQKLKGRK